jgi:hypothetical protein
MISNWLNTLGKFGVVICEICLVPGEFMLTSFAELAPVTARAWGIAEDGNIIAATAVTSGFFWLLMVIIAWRLYRYSRSFARNLIALLRTALYRASEAARSLKTLLVCRLREFSPRQADDGIDMAPEIDFDDLDLAVLRSAAARGPGLATSAPEIAEVFKLRPSEVQRSIDKLRQNRMLDTVIGSTDGYGNFRLSNYGATFMAMWQRQQAS